MQRVLLAVLLILMGSTSAHAQCLPPLLPPGEAPPCKERYPAWSGELAVLGVNSLLSGVSAGVLHKLKHGSFSDAFVRGVAGGAVVYGGKRIAVERFGGAGLVGRQVAALGSSMVRNAGEGRGMIEQVMLPVGPLWLYLQSSAPRVRVRLDLVSTGWLLSAIREPELNFNAGMSISAGAAVFITDNRLILAGRDSAHSGGIAEPGVLFMSDIPTFGRDFARRNFEHERVHVLQMDQIFITITDPFEDAVMARLPYVRAAGRYVDINLSSVLLEALNGRIPRHLDRPWETEAIFFSR